MDLKIINSNENDIMEFKSVEEFNLYYQKNKEMMESKTTQYLNKVYKILPKDGINYRITKIHTRDENGKRQNGEICLKRVIENKPEVVKMQNEEDENKYGEIIEKLIEKYKMLNDGMKKEKALNNERFQEIENKMKIINENVKNIINALNNIS